MRHVFVLGALLFIVMIFETTTAHGLSFGDRAVETPGATISFHCNADLDGSGVVDGDDLEVFERHWGECPAGFTCMGDLNGDDVVDADDILLFDETSSACVCAQSFCDLNESNCVNVYKTTMIEEQSHALYNMDRVDTNNVGTVRVIVNPGARGCANSTWVPSIDIRAVCDGHCSGAYGSAPPPAATYPEYAACMAGCMNVIRQRVTCEVPESMKDWPDEFLPVAYCDRYPEDQRAACVAGCNYGIPEITRRNARRFPWTDMPWIVADGCGGWDVEECESFCHFNLLLELESELGAGQLKAILKDLACRGVMAPDQLRGLLSRRLRGLPINITEEIMRWYYQCLVNCTLADTPDGPDHGFDPLNPPEF